MIRGRHLLGRPVVDMDAAVRLGKIKEIIVQRDGERVAGFVVAHGENLLGSGGTRRIIPASALNAIGPDVITVRGGAIKEIPDLDSLPRMSDIIGHKMVTQSGRLLGSIDDVLIEESNGTIIGFALGEGVKSRLENVFSPEKGRVRGYVRADADLQVGDALIVVPDDALIEGEPATRESDDRTAPTPEKNVPVETWSADPGRERRSVWSRRDDAAERSPVAQPRQPAPSARTSEPFGAEQPADRTPSVPIEPPDDDPEVRPSV